MTTEVKQATFEELYEQQCRQTGKLFDSRLEKLLVDKGTHFPCYACTHSKPWDDLGRKMGNRYYCRTCYEVIKKEPKTKDRGDD